MSNLCEVRRAALVLGAVVHEVGHTCHQLSMCFLALRTGAGPEEQPSGQSEVVQTPWTVHWGVWHLLRFVLCDSVLEHTLRWPMSTSKPPAPPGVSARELATWCADPFIVCL